MASPGGQGESDVNVTVTVNGEVHADDVEPRILLVHHLRDALGLTGTNVGCDTSSCGACTVLVDGESVRSCTMLAVQADGHAVTTIEGLAATTDGGDLHPMQQVFHEDAGGRCGYSAVREVSAAPAW
jgi:carbon-monoxide dehydrogenase small subunit